MVSASTKTSQTPKETPTSEVTEKEMPISEEERTLASFGYIGFMFILPLLKKDSEFCQWHGKQALVLNVGLFFIGLFLLAIPGFPLLGPLAALFKLIIFLGAIFIIATAYNKTKKGAKWKIPYISQYVDKIPKL